MRSDRQQGIYDPNGFFQRNEKLKAANNTEYVTEEEFARRTTEIVRCKGDIKYFANNYFYIIGSSGRQIIPLYRRQAELLDFLVTNPRVIVKCPRQCGKTTANSILALWFAIFNNDKRILVVANKMEVVLEIMQRVQFAYEELPFWLKPGVNTWNKGKLVFSNGSTIVGTSTTSTAARSKSAEIILIDEFAWIPANLLEPFFTSILPIASSFKESKIICVSTPNGVSNKFYELYSAAEMNLGNGEGWRKFDICLDDVPGRDAAWRKARLAEFNNDMVKYAQEYECVFHGSSYTLIKKETIRRIKDRVIGPEWREPETVALNQDWSYRRWKRPVAEHCYVLAADPASGVGSDYSVALVFDVTDVTRIEQVASFCSNVVSTLEFPYVLAKMGIAYNRAVLAMESNSIGDGILNSLSSTYEYENIFHHNKGNGRLGIFSHVQTKGKACRWLRDLMSFEEVEVAINDKELVAEMEWFERKPTACHEVYQATGSKHDDHMMALVWGMFAIHPENAEGLFHVARSITLRQIGLQIPCELRPIGSSYFREVDSAFDEDESDPDEIFNRQLFGAMAYREMPPREDDLPGDLGFSDGMDDDGGMDGGASWL